jgi:alpha-N-arabinofuranosidase
MVLTQGPKMLLTPTYHVFEMYKVHQDATRVPCDLESDPYTFEGQSIPMLSACASRAQDGTVHLSLCNLHHAAEASVSCTVRGKSVRKVSGRVLTAVSIRAHNTFGKPDTVKPVAFRGCRRKRDTLSIALPPRSVTVLALA